MLQAMFTRCSLLHAMLQEQTAIHFQICCMQCCVQHVSGVDTRCNSPMAGWRTMLHRVSASHALAFINPEVVSGFDLSIRHPITLVIPARDCFKYSITYEFLILTILVVFPNDRRRQKEEISGYYHQYAFYKETYYVKFTLIVFEVFFDLCTVACKVARGSCCVAFNAIEGLQAF